MNWISFLQWWGEAPLWVELKRWGVITSVVKLWIGCTAFFGEDQSIFNPLHSLCGFTRVFCKGSRHGNPWKRSESNITINSYYLGIDSGATVQKGWRDQALLRCFVLWTITIFGFVNQTSRVFQVWLSYQLCKGTNINNGTGHEKETPIHVDRGHALCVLCHEAVKGTGFWESQGGLSFTSDNVSFR